MKLLQKTVLLIILTACLTGRAWPAEDFKIPLRDGTKLAASLWRAGPGAKPVMLMRGTGTHWNWTDLNRWHEAGYHCVANDYRPSKWYENDRKDGYDVIEWIAKQDWCNGQVVMFGKSKWGISQWRAAQTKPPHLVAIVPQVHGLRAIKEYNKYELGRGVHKADSTWEEYLNIQVISPEDEQIPSPLGEQGVLSLSNVKLTSSDDQPWEYQVWSEDGAREEFKNVNIPVFIYGGWYDRYPDRQFLHYLGAKKFSSSPNVRLVIDVTDHLGRVKGKRDFEGKVPYDLQGEVIKWLEPILKGDVRQTGPNITLFAMGVNEWRTYNQWPSPERKPTKFYFSSPAGKKEGTLITDVPGNEKPSEYIYDPDNPTPTLGCSNSEWRDLPLMPIGPYDQKSLGLRSDVLVFRTPPLQADVDVTGPLMVKLYAATDVKCTGWVVQLMDEYPDGTSYNLMEGIINARTYGKGKSHEYTMDLRATSNVFLKGHRIRVHITSSLFPLWERNLNTCTRKAKATDIKIAHQKVFHDKEHPSYILLPIMGNSGTQY